MFGCFVLYLIMASNRSLSLTVVPVNKFSGQMLICSGDIIILTQMYEGITITTLANLPVPIQLNIVFEPSSTPFAGVAWSILMHGGMVL